MKSNYKPPFRISAKSINLIAEISTQIERYVYSTTELNVRFYEGEWSRHLSGIGVWAGDLELPKGYDEGIRIPVDNRYNDSQKVSNTALRKFVQDKFTRFLVSAGQ